MTEYTEMLIVNGIIGIVLGLIISGPILAYFTGNAMWLLLCLMIIFFLAG